MSMAWVPGCRRHMCPKAPRRSLLIVVVSLSPELRTKCLPNAEKCLDVREFFPLEIMTNMRDVLAKMRECGKGVKMRDG